MFDSYLNSEDARHEYIAEGSRRWFPKQPADDGADDGGDGYA
jgi:hypothetical protein